MTRDQLIAHNAALQSQVDAQEKTILRQRVEISEWREKFARLQGAWRTQQNIIEALRRKLGETAKDAADSIFKGRLN